MNRSLIMIPRFRLLFLFNVYNQGNKEHIIAGMLDCFIRYLIHHYQVGTLK